MLHIAVANQEQHETVQQETGPIEFGRASQKGLVRRVLINDPCTSRDHLRLEELPDGRVRVLNLSQTRCATLDNGVQIATGEHSDIPAPFAVVIGTTTLRVTQSGNAEVGSAEVLQTIAQPIRSLARDHSIPGLMSLGATPAPESLMRWLELVLSLFQSSSDLEEVYRRAAEALVRIVGLDLGLVLRQAEGGWVIAASHVHSDSVRISFSRTLMQHVVTQRRTFYQDPRQLQAESLSGVSAAVVSPIFGLTGEVVAALYGVRSRRPGGPTGIRWIEQLEAQLVQLLAAAVGLSFTRAVATRTRILFEQFFSPELARELERNPNLLEGRSQQVTVLCSDLRGFTRMSERLGPQETFRIIGEVMEHLSKPIIAFGGAIVDYAGDGILAMWNAPVEQPDHAVRACRAALAMQNEMPTLNGKWQPIVGCALEIGIGLNTGEALVGNTGSSYRFKYGPHGYTVNLTSRVQDATKKVGLPILLTEPLRKLLPAEFILNPTAPVQLPGVAEEQPLYALRGEVPASLLNDCEPAPAG